MAEDTSLTRLNFHYEEISKTLIDKLLGLKISCGHLSGLSRPFVNFQDMNNGFAIAIQEQGMPQNELDQHCQKLAEDARIQGVELLITKSDLPFDNRWFIAGDLKQLLDMARLDKIHCPFSDFLYDDIETTMNNYN